MTMCMEPRDKHGLPARGDVMSEMVDPSTWQFAVIALRTEPRRERLVIAYPDEKALHSLIAAPSIIALGYHSRDRAAADIDQCAPTAVVPRRTSGAAIVGVNEQSRQETCAAKRRTTGRFGLVWGRSAIGHVLRYGVAAAIVLLHSRNILSATVRAFVSF